ncbi:hypothetical protein I6H47_08285 [Brevibacterium casei]|uniref:Uncharacterized protein n=1 Tax=Brevibacterium casei TaxID=33889 RepID=A0A7T4A2G2_9MICO|nr:hypothetical protein I6H47_08285 [Brevibacterium casei]
MDDSPTYRVNFWERSGTEAWNLEAFVLADARDLHEVLDWISNNERGRRVELFVELEGEPFTSLDTPRKTDLIRLSGSDANDGDTAFTFGAVPE